MIRVNGDNEEFIDETVLQLLQRRGIEPRGIAVALDGEVVPRGAWAETKVHDGTQVEVVTAVAGG